MIKKSVFPALAVALLLAGCGSSKSSSSANSSSTSSGKGCKDASAATVGAALGKTYGEPEANSSVSDVVVCTYRSDSGSIAIIRFQKNVDASAFAASRQQSDNQSIPTSDVAGVGDQAYSSQIGRDPYVTNTLVARTGSNEVLITSNSSLSQEKALMDKLL